MDNYKIWTNGHPYPMTAWCYEKSYRMLETIAHMVDLRRQCTPATLREDPEVQERWQHLNGFPKATIDDIVESHIGSCVVAAARLFLFGHGGIDHTEEHELIDAILKDGTAGLERFVESHPPGAKARFDRKVIEFID